MPSMKKLLIEDAAKCFVLLCDFLKNEYICLYKKSINNLHRDI